MTLNVCDDMTALRISLLTEALQEQWSAYPKQLKQKIMHFVTHRESMNREQHMHMRGYLVACCDLEAITHEHFLFLALSLISVISRRDSPVVSDAVVAYILKLCRDDLLTGVQ